MKKRIFSILLTLCMVLMLCPVTAFADENYMITQNFKYGTRTYDGTDPQTSPYQFAIPAGGSFGLATIEDCSPYELVGWKESVSGTVYPPYAEIQNLQSALTFDAVYQVQGGLTITVDGFMPGKTVGDCTVTMESTIPDIEFSKDDINLISWFKYTSHGDVNPPVVVENTDLFEADAVYQLGIVLKNNGLELVPSTTVNGIAPHYSKVVSNEGVPYALEIECDLGTPVAPTLAITVDNFEVGKTPADITYSFASTNLGVTFSESDILGVTWEYYDSYAEDFYTVDGTNVLQDTDYRVTIELDSKGLTEAPAVTVNGKTPESCEIVTSGGKTVLRITCELGAPLAQQLTISGPFEVCKDQDYEFSVTAAEGAEVSYSVYRFGEYGSELPWSRVEDGVYYGTVPASEYGDADSMVLTVYGTAASGKPATATKTVLISKEHHFIDGVCRNCGAKPEYTITYDGGEGVEGSIAPDTKANGVPVTLSGETFKMDGFIQTGWVDKETGAIYKLAATYDEDRDATLYPYWEKLVTVTAPFTTTVALGDAGEPGETTFELALIDGNGNELTFDGMYFGAEITTDGAGSYSGEVTITATEKWLYDMLYEGAFIWQYDDEEESWTYDDTVWGVRLYMPEVAARSMDAVQYELLLYPTYLMDDGSFNLDLNAGPVDEMTFTNTYTAHAYELNHDADGHWDECDCGDIQNEEAHKYGDWKVTKEATEKEAGEKEHTCTVCGYTEKAEIAKRPATTDPTNPDTKPGSTSPQTGDNSHMALWLALLFVSGAGVIGTTVYGKKKRAK